MMKNIFKKFKSIGALLVVVATFGIFNAIANAAPAVVFNNGAGETDFLRINDANGGNTAEACTNGQTVDLWFYVHNTNPTVLNGAKYDGIGVAKNAVVDIDFGSDYSKTHPVTAKVTADNAAISTDGVTINCGTKEVKLEYVSQSLTQDANAPAGVNYTMTGNIMNGAKIGYNNGSENVFPGCFEYRAYIKVRVKVTVKPEPVVIKKCVPAQVVYVDRTKRDINVAAEVQNANVTKYVVTVKNKSGAVVTTKEEATSAKNFTYRFDQPAGEYTATVKVVTDKGDADNTCDFNITIEDEPKDAYYRCENFVISINGRKVVATFKPVFGNGASFKQAVVNYNNGTGSVITTDKIGTDGNVTTEYTYPGEGDLNNNVVATLTFSVNGQDKTVDCSSKASVQGIKKTPGIKKIYDTGAGDMLALAVIVAVAGTVAYRKYTIVKNGQ
jgi:hypothetical protein